MPTAITRSLQRDAYIVAQALYVAIKTMRAVEPPEAREVSNINDMELILEKAYPGYLQVFKMQDAANVKT